MTIAVAILSITSLFCFLQWMSCGSRMEAKYEECKHLRRMLEIEEAYNRTLVNMVIRLREEAAQADKSEFDGYGPN